MADAPAPSRSRWFTETKDPQLLRQFSELADDSVKSFIGDRVGPVTSTIFILNSLTGLSLLTLPYGFSRAGLALGALILFVCMVMAFVTSTFMCEALSIANALQYEAAEVRKLENDPEVLAKIRKEKEEIVTTISEPLLKERMVKHHNTVDLFVHDNRGCNAEREFKIRERLELGVMGEQVLKGSRGRVWSAMIYATVMIYVLGTATALVVTVNKSLRGTMCSAVDLASNGVHQCDVHSGVIIYKCSVVVTFFLVLPLCFADIQKTKRFTMGIMVVRFIAIACLLLISSWFAGQRIHREGWSAVQGQLPMWNIGEFASVYGNAVFLYGLHQYLPSMVSPLEKQTQAPWVILAAFLICYVIILSVCATAMVAWGGEAHGSCSTYPGGHFCQIQDIYSLNFAPVSQGHGAVSLFLVTYPAMAVASIPIAAITLRNTMGRCLDLPPADPNNPYTRSNTAMTLGVLLPPFAVAFFTEDVQAVIKYVGGYAGLTTATFFPVLLVWRGRRMLDQSVSERGTDSVPLRDDRDRPLKSPCAGLGGYAVVVTFYLASLLFVTKQLFFSE